MTIESKNDFEIEPPRHRPSAKVNGLGKAAVLSAQQAELLFEEGFVRDRDRLIFAICYFTGCRISECLQLRRIDIGEGMITFPGRILKGKGHPSRQVQMPRRLVLYSQNYQMPEMGYLFPAHAKATKQAYLSRVQATRILKAACERVGLSGVSTHSFRRSYISGLWRHGLSPYQIKELTGHRSMSSLMEYLER